MGVLERQVGDEVVALAQTPVSLKGGIRVWPLANALGRLVGSQE
jgi:hypothetical protein